MSGEALCQWFWFSLVSGTGGTGVLRYRNGFGLFDSVRFGLWLARG